MSFFNGLSSDEVNELIEAVRNRYHFGDITETEFRTRLAKLGMNATAIDEEERYNRPATD